MMPSRVVFTCPRCGNREEREAADAPDMWGCPNCGTEMRRRFVYPRGTTSHRITTTRAGNGVVEVNVTPRETR